MTPDPVILILEDERPQILTLRTQLAGIGRLVEFTDPEPALEYARRHPCDAAIIDIRMPRSSMDGLGFLRKLREFDRDLAVIIRTASESDRIADGAIEMRAIKRAVKSRTTLAEMRESTKGAIRETRERREINRNARDTSEVKVRLAEALGAYDLRLAAADLHRGLVHGLRNRITALSALSSLISEDAARSGDAAFVEHAGRSAAIVGAMVDSVNEFLDGPFGERGAEPGAGINDCLEALGLFFMGAERWAGEGKTLAIRDLISDTRVDCIPLALMNGLRHLVEHLFERTPSGTEVAVTAAIVQGAEKVDELLAGCGCVLNRDSVRRERPYVVVRAAASLPQTSLEQLRDAFSFGSDAARTGNLKVLGEVLTSSKGAALLDRNPAGLFSIAIMLPVAL
jgi:CheY-like chemotaxis protein